MSSLYLDTTMTLKVGLLDSDFKWIEYFDTQEKKTAQIIHKIIFDLLSKYNVSLKHEIDNVFVVVGPGSYTGLRIAKGIVDILRWQKLNVYSFYLHQIPQLLGVDKGGFLCNAFKKQYFFYSWAGNKNNIELVDKIPSEKNVYTNDLSLLSESKNIDQFILNDSIELFNRVKKDQLRESIFYFRKIEEEFKVTSHE